MAKVIVLGDPGVGKTSLANRYVNNKFTTVYKATIGADIFSKELVLDGHEVFLQIWDTAGQERFHSLGPGYFRGADACALVYDVTNMRSFEALDKWCEDFISNAGLKPDQTETFPFIVIGNKCDLRDNRQVSLDRALAWCEKVQFPHYESSAREAKNVNQAFEDLALRTLENEDISLPLYDFDETERAFKALEEAENAPLEPENGAEVDTNVGVGNNNGNVRLDQPAPDDQVELNCCGMSVRV